MTPHIRIVALALTAAVLLLALLTTPARSTPRSVPERSVSAVVGATSHSPAQGPSEAPSIRPTSSPSQPVAAALTAQPTTTPDASPVVEGSMEVVASVTGTASWYRYVPGQAAAGPRLRALLGPGWRGMTVRVNGIPVRLTDWCQCYQGRPDERVVDLDARTFARLAQLGIGLVVVEVVG